MLTLSQIYKSQATVNTITLEPLEEMTINQLIADTLSCTNELARPLTQWVYQKTKGNPFFTTQFLKALHEEGWIQFQPELGYWQCDMISVRQLALSDDVLEFMTLQLVKLPMETQEVLKLAACIGNQFDLKTLVTVSEKSVIDTATNLWKALQEGFIIPVSETYKFFQSNELDNIDRGSEIIIPYKFLHDRVQQAAYSLIPEEQKQTTHFRIGQLLLKETSLEERQEKLFEIAGQLNIGKALITEQQERDTLARLNWEAGERAKTATAYTTALDFFSVGIDLLAVNGWERQYELSLALYSSAAEVAYLSGDFERMDQLIQIVLKHAKTLLDQIRVYQTQIQAYQSQDHLLQAIETALSVLKLLDIRFPEQPSLSDIQTALDEVSSSLSETSIENLIDLPCMSDPHKLAAMRILLTVAPSVKQSVPTLLPLIVQKMVFLSLQNGNAAESTFAYALYGSVLCITGGNIDTGYRFTQLGLNLLQRFANKEFQSRTYFVANFFVVHWKDHLRKTLHPLLEAYQSGLETGDLEHAAWSANCYCIHAYFVGNSLPELESEITSYSEVIEQSKQLTALNTLSICQQVVLTWLGKRQVFHSLNDKNDYLEDLLHLLLKLSICFKSSIYECS
jgi:predicted ATPase